MVVIMISDQLGLPEIDLVHYNTGIKLAQRQFELTYGFKPKFGFMRLENPRRVSIACDPDYTFTMFPPEGDKLN